MCRSFAAPIIAFFCLATAVQSQNYSLRTVAGQTNVIEGADATQSLLRYPVGVAADSLGNTYISDEYENRVWKIDAAGKITTLAGKGTASYGGDGGSGSNAALNAPTGLAVDSSGNVYICDAGNNLVRKVTPSGIISTVAGNRKSAASVDGGPATSASVAPFAIAVDKAGNLFISEGTRIRVVSAATGIINTISGNLVVGYSGDNGPAINAVLSEITGMAFDAAGNLYLADFDACAIRKIDTSNIITTIGGNGNCAYSGDGGPATSAKMVPFGLAVDPAGTTLYLSEPRFSTIRQIDLASQIITVAGGTNGQIGFKGDGQPVSSTVFWEPYGMTIDRSMNLLICDTLNQRVRKIDGLSRLVSTIAGTNSPAFLNHPEGISVDAKGNLNIADTGDNIARQVNLNTGTINSLPLYPTLKPEGIAEDSSGNLYITSQFPMDYLLQYATNAQYYPYAGNGKNGYTGDNGRATSASLGTLTSVTVDSSNNVYVTDDQYYKIRKIDTNGNISLIAGNGSPSASGDGNAALSAGMDPFDITIDKSGNMYVADRTNNRIRKFTPGGAISTVAGTGTAGNSGDNGPATAATLNSPTGVAVDPAGNIYIADAGNNLLRKVAADGTIHTIAGNGVPYPFNGDGPALQQNLNPFRVAVDNNGNVYISDRANDRIRKLVQMNGASLSIVGGNNQTGTIGLALSQLLKVQVLGTDGNPYAGATVSFAVAAGSATVSPASGVTGVDGTATTVVTLGDTPGPVTVNAVVAGLATVTFSLTATAAPNVPQIFTGGVVSAGLSSPAMQIASPNAILSIFGQNFAPAGTSRKVSGSDLVNGLVPNNLAGVCVLFGNARAPIFLVTPGQVNVQAPQLPASGTVPVQVVTNCDSPLAQLVSNNVSVPVQAAAPEFFYSSINANGQNSIAATDGVTGAGVGDPARLGTGFALAHPGEIIQIYATGFGLTNPAFAPGELPSTGAQISGMSVSIDGIPLDASAIRYAGVAPMNAGLYQLNLVLPSALTPGDHTITMSINGVTSPAGSYISVGQ